MNGFQRAGLFFPSLPSGSLQNWPLSPPGFVSLPPPGALFHLNLDQLVRQLCGRTNLVEPTKEIRPKLRGLPIRRAIIDPTPPGGEGALIVHIHAAGSPHEELHWNQCPQLDMQKGCIYVKLCARESPEFFLSPKGWHRQLPHPYHL